MKILRTDNELISLENVRKVTANKTTSKHTSMGKPYTLDTHTVIIEYCDNHIERIKCGEDTEGAKMSKMILDNIYQIFISEKG